MVYKFPQSSKLERSLLSGELQIRIGLEVAILHSPLATRVEMPSAG